jgi:hypothetical protein
MLNLALLTKSSNINIFTLDHTKKAAPLLCGHVVWGSCSAGDSGAMACRAVLYCCVKHLIYSNYYRFYFLFSLCSLIETKILSQSVQFLILLTVMSLTLQHLQEQAFSGRVLSRGCFCLNTPKNHPLMPKHIHNNRLQKEYLSP